MKSIVRVIKLAVLFPLSAQFVGVASGNMSNSIGIYFDEVGTTTCLESGLTYPLLCNAYIILKQVNATGGIGAWEASVDWDSTLTVFATGFRGQAFQFDTFPEIRVGLGTPLPADSLVVLADLQIYAAGPGGLYIKPHSSPMITGADSPIFVFGNAPDLFALTAYAFGSSENACATLGLPECPTQNFFSEALPDSGDTSLAAEFVVVAKRNSILLPDRNGPFPFAELTFGSPELRSLLASFGTLSVDRVFDRAMAREIEGRNGQVVEILGGNDAFVFQLENAEKTDIEGQFGEVSSVLSIELNTEGSNLQYILPNDPGLPAQWAIMGSSNVDVINAWQYSLGSPAITICIVDKGAYSNHPEFLGKRSGDSDYVGDHGARVAGIAAANTNNAVGIAGVNQRAHVNFQRHSDTPSSMADAVARGLTFLPHVMNHSYRYYGGGSGSLLHRLLIDAYKLGVVHTIAAGNHYESGDPHIFPARFGWAWDGYDQGMVVVAGSTSQGTVYNHSSSGPHTDITAPAAGVISTTNSALIGEPADGTSFAAPHAAGAAAILATLWTNLTPDDIEAVLKLSARDIGVQGFDERTGWGLLQVGGAIELLNGRHLRQMTFAEGGVTEIGVQHWHNVVLEGFPGYSSDPRSIDVIKVQGAITFPDEYVAPPAVWGRGNGSTGLGARPWYNVNYTRVVPESITTTGCIVESYVYRIPGTSNYIPGSYYPFSQVTWAISILGERVVTGVDDIPGYQSDALTMKMAGPNPFNASTTFSVNVAEHTAVRIYVCDLRGRLVRSFVAGDKAEGLLQIEWDGRDDRGRDCASGVYLAIAETSIQRAELKIVLAK